MIVVDPPNRELHAKIAAVEIQMRAKLDEIRATFANPGNKGSGTEDLIRSFLRTYLPRYLEVGHGEVIDSHGGRSPQTDVVIATEDHPFTFTTDLPGLFFVEGVGGAGEVKTLLASREIESTCEKAATFKRLRPLPFTGFFIGGSDGSDDRVDSPPPYFLVALESQVRLETIRDQLNTYRHHNQLNSGEFLDAVFVLGVGTVIDFGDGNRQLRADRPDGSHVTGWEAITGQSGLFDLLAWLSSTVKKRLRMDSILTRYMLPDHGLEPGTQP
jgi:hypothetical protein